MMDVIDFLERMGQDAGLRHAPEAVLEQAMRDAQMDPGARAALLRGDRAGIEAVIGCGGNVCCLIHAPTPEDEKQADVPKPQKAVIGVDNNVCCIVFAPPPDTEEGDEGTRQPKAA